MPIGREPPTSAPRLTIVAHYPIARADGKVFTFNRVGEVVDGLRRSGWQATVVAREWPQEALARANFELRDVPIVTVQRQPLPALRALLQTDAALVFMPSLLSALATLVLGRRAVMYAGASWKLHPGFGRLRALLESLAARRARSVLASGHAVARRFQPVAREVELCVPLVAQEVISRLRSGEAPASQPGPLRALFVGAIARTKGVPELLEALRDLPTVDCRIVGPPDDAALAAEAASLPNVTVLGYVDWEELRAQYEWANVLVLPSHTEGFPRVAFEAAAFGLALVLTPVGGIPMRLAHEQDALLVPVGSSTELGLALRRLESDYELRARLALGAQRSLAEALRDPDSTTQFDRLLRAIAT